MCVLCVFFHRVFVSYSLFNFTFALCHHHRYYLLCYVAPHLILQLFSMVHHSLPCIVTACGALLVPCTNVTCCGVSSFTLCCYYLLWCVVPHFTLLFILVHHPHLVLLLLFTEVCCPSPCIATLSFHAFSKYSPHCVIVACCGLSFLALCYY
jgi:hypothetical protein